MNLWSDLEWKCALESESELEVKGKHLQHKDMTN